MNILAQDIALQCKMLHCANLQVSKIENLLDKLGIKNAYEFGEYYNFKEPYKQFLYEYLGAA